MRDPKRIQEFCNRLAEVWTKECPDWRFAQIYANVAYGRDLFYMEDDELMDEIEAYFHYEK